MLCHSVTLSKQLFYVFCCLNSGHVHVALLSYMNVIISVIYACGGKYIVFSFYVAHLLNMRIFTKSHRLDELQGLPLLSFQVSGMSYLYFSA